MSAARLWDAYRLRALLMLLKMFEIWPPSTSKTAITTTMTQVHRCRPFATALSPQMKTGVARLALQVSGLTRFWQLFTGMTSISRRPRSVPPIVECSEEEVAAYLAGQAAAREASARDTREGHLSAPARAQRISRTSAAMLF